MKKTRKKREVKKVIHKSLRFTEEDWQTIKTDMENRNFHSFTKYACDALKKRRIYVADESNADQKLHDQIKGIMFQMAKFGNNLNQVVKRYNYITGLKKQDGSPAISEVQVAFYIKQIADVSAKIHAEYSELTELTKNHFSDIADK